VSFILRILFTGLIAFVPSEDGKELTILLLNVDHTYHTSDGTSLSHHTPLLLARAGNCTGQCTTEDNDIAQFIYADKTPEVALDSLANAVSGGGAWKLDGSELSVHKGSSTDPDLPALLLRQNVRGTVNGQPQMIPTTSAEREDFSWLADLKQVCPGCSLTSSVLGSQPPAGLVAARFRLKAGTVFTYSIARTGSNVSPVNFKRLDGQGSASPYSQAVASWVGADIEVAGSSVQITEDRFDSGTGRSMTLSPDTDGKVEMAVLNLPPFVPPASTSTLPPEVGKHFEMYYELSQTPPAQETRLVPRAGAAPENATYPEVDWQQVHPPTEVWSQLLNEIRLDIGRGVYERVLCPPVKDPLP
jgi:hypothetical protein